MNGNTIRTFVLGHLAHLYQKARPRASKIEEQLYSYRITRRRVKYVLLAGLIFLATSVAFLFAVYVIQEFYKWFNVEVTGQVINYSQFVTAVVVAIVADLPILILTGIFLHWILRESKSPTPNISHFTSGLRRSTDSAKILYVLVENDGEVAAQDCQARLILTDVKAKDIIRISDSSKFTSDNFRPPLKVNLQWQTGKKDITIRSGDDARFDILKIVKDSEDKVHFEVPSEDGETEIACAIRPDYYHGFVRVVPFNGRHATKSFVMTYDSDAGQWDIMFW